MDIVSGMYKFQKDRGIKDQCVTNTQYLYDSIKNSYNLASYGSAYTLGDNINVKARACLVLTLNQETMELRTITHLVLGIDGTDKILDPSYDIASLKPKHYYFDLNTYMQANKEITLPPDFKRKIIEKFMAFLDLAERMNAGELLVCDKAFYNAQADFLESMNKIPHTP